MAMHGITIDRNYRRFAICTVKLSMYICKISFPDVSLSTSDCTDCTLANRTVVKKTFFNNDELSIRSDLYP